MIHPAPRAGTPEAERYVDDFILRVRDVTDARKHFSAPIAGPARPRRAFGSERPSPRTLGELMRQPGLMDPPPQVLPHGLALKGCATLLSAREKVGKSTMLSQAAAAKSCGGEFLGVALTAGPVLWYALDEPVGDLVRRLKVYGADLENFSIQTEIPTADHFYSEIGSTGAELVNVDTVSRMWRGKVRSANDGEEIASFLWPFIEVIRATSAAGCFTYHTSKGGKEYRGSVEIGACVDVPLTMRKRGQDAVVGDTFDADYQADDRRDDGRRLLTGIGRGVNVSLRLTFADGRYTLGDAARPLRERVRAELALDPASSNSLAEVLSTRKAAVLEVLHEMRATGEVEAQGTGPRQVWALRAVGSRL